jgi:phenylacetate-CoA ligase
MHLLCRLFATTWEIICKFVEKTCSCGSSFPLIEPPLGRREDLIRLPSGQVLSPWGFFFILRSFDGIDQFRVIQEGFDHFVLQIVFRERPQDETLLKIRSRVMEYLSEPVRLDIQVVDFIQEEKLKFRIFISKLPESNL